MEAVEKIKPTTTGKTVPTEINDATAAAKKATFETSAEATQSSGKTNVKNECLWILLANYEIPSGEPKVKQLTLN